MMAILRGSIICIGLLLIWHFIVSYWQLPDYILPSPQRVFFTLYQQRLVIAHESIPTIIEIVSGFGIGILVGCITGMMISFFHPLKSWILPILIVSQTIPVFAIAPIIVIWLGYGLASKIAITVLMTYFPIASAFYDGLHHTNQHWLDLGKTMGANKWRTYWHIKIPAALPTLASGIRIAAVAAPIGAIVGEWVGSSQGLGYLMLNANARMQIDMMFAALIVIIAIALTMYMSTDKLLHKLIWWQK